jgi:hypothetical protein
VVIRILRYLGAFVATLALLWFVAVSCWPLRIIGEGFDRQRHLLLSTDYDALLEACRHLMARVERGELETGVYYVRSDPTPETASFPTIILDLEPTYVEIREEGWVTVELFGGFDHFGVVAFPRDWPTEASDRRLIRGLWYYDSDLGPHQHRRGRVNRLVDRGIRIHRDRKARAEAERMSPAHSP